jgi:hypothetical protein
VVEDVELAAVEVAQAVEVEGAAAAGAVDDLDALVRRVERGDHVAPAGGACG